eukprot:GDKJ01000516.1.p1 GENE.GDKJ01000516.1~~GDKJ01000516.1.p1  ORF type:complete len:242 (+),score=43.24 GDKJ01000516.1:24-749(+)
MEKDNTSRKTKNGCINMLLNSEFSDEVSRLLGDEIDDFSEVESIGSSSPSDWEREICESMNICTKKRNTFFNSEKPKELNKFRSVSTTQLPNLVSEDIINGTSAKLSIMKLSTAEKQRIVKESFSKMQLPTSPKRPLSREKGVRLSQRISELALPRQKLERCTTSNGSPNPPPSTPSDVIAKDAKDAKLKLLATYNAVQTAQQVKRKGTILKEACEAGVSAAGITRAASSILQVVKSTKNS